MTSYRELYFDLFGKLADATELLLQGHALLALDLMLHAQSEAEARCMETDFIPDVPFNEPKP